MEKRKGIWIPGEFIENKELDWANKALLSEICSLHQLPKGCIASNDHFGRFLGMNSGSASKRISQLRSMGYIKTQNFYEKGNCVGRVVSPNTNKIKTIQDSTSQMNQGVVPEQQGGESSTTSAVVPIPQEGTSLQHIINTSTRSLDKEIDENIKRKNSTEDKNTRNNNTGNQNTRSEGKSVEVKPIEELWQIFARAYAKFNKEEQKSFMLENDAGKIEFIKKWEAQQFSLEAKSESCTI